MATAIAQRDQAEWQARVELAALYRIVHAQGLTDLIHNHITLRVPGTTDQFLINPFGLDYSEVTASSLVIVDLDGRTVSPSPHGYGINRAGFIIHSAIHAARHDLVCIAHTHSRAAVAVSCLEAGLMPINQNALRFVDDLAYHDYEGPAFREDERAHLIESLGTKDNMILRNHGVIAAGQSIAHCYVNLMALELACRIQLDVLAMGQPIHPVTPDAIEQSRQIMAMAKAPMGGSLGDYPGPVLEWQAAMRVLDRMTTDYKN